MSEWPIRYRDFEISPYSHYKGARWIWSHKDYDGPGDNRCGVEDTIDRCKIDIDTWYEEEGDDSCE
jgi:hypothetical protein